MDLTHFHSRSAQQNDAQKLARLHHFSHQESFREFADQDWIASRSFQDYLDFWEDFLQNLEKREAVYTTWFGDLLVGTVTLKELKNSSAIFRPSGKNRKFASQVCCLRLMYVHPDFLRQGLGRLLMEFFCAHMEDAGFRSGTLITHAANQRARRFYESQGWELDEIFSQQVEEFFEEPEEMRARARYIFDLSS